MAMDKRPRRAPQEADRRRDSGRTRERIISAAVGEFSAHGYSGARVTRIAKAAGVNAQLISYHFDGKAGLYQAVLQRGTSALDPLPAADRPLSDIAADYVRITGRNADITRLLAWEGLGDTPEAGEHTDIDRHGQGRAAFMRGVVDQLRGRQAAGEFPADLDSGHLLFALYAMASAPVLLPQVARQIFGADADRDDFQEAFAQQVARLVEHLATPPAAP
ncbi:TetR family transcriptional regulator [Streptomyces sp. SID14478]|uniref:TetR/AcrR family transcriptional regulator n=1 Tax=Streptomyces sp. SID14478 TaxID=2706073 RepID=UPI0013DB4A15|nr:TetR family transcriptional regulator [Streptomyces sp. SID14478]NEB75554.1 TetR family transcriptional regulator [Streptomyces sp. SID14478]